MAKRGCSKCLKEFPQTRENKADYSGFEYDQWLLRSKEQHLFYAQKAQQAKSKAEQSRLEGIYGARYSRLHELPYFDPVRMHLIDSMHNILEGTAKRVMQVWRETGTLDSQSFKVLQSRVNCLKVPGDLDPDIPSKIESAFQGFTASQWKIWVCTYSLFALKCLLSENDYNIWKCFVSAARILCARVITRSELADADRCLRVFCNRFEQKYGKRWCSMNMHLHLHLKSCIEDYGPVHGFWCFSFERANGTLGDYHTNSRHTEVIIMHKWLPDWQISQKHDKSSLFKFKGRTHLYCCSYEIYQMHLDLPMSFQLMSPLTHSALCGHNLPVFIFSRSFRGPLIAFVIPRVS